ncbi:indole-3-acetic acid-amido synthetase GH3.17-like [Euphorbia lathyris]|uniref:indole-3-acetic acid-amido synthetase GH3.17-like n=1 Tax=Euphorbia lathyris TaxID=212925 RepID=UPI0033144AE6
MLPSFDPNDTEQGLQLLEKLTCNAGAIQEKVLEEILLRNGETEYLRKFINGRSGGGGVYDKQKFKKNVKVVSYEDIKPCIDRIANGSEPSSSIISSQPITELLTSSGTSGGQPKMMPSTAEDLDRKTFFYNLLVPVMNKYIDGLDQGKAMYLLFVKPETSTPSGLMARPVLTSYYKSKNFKNRPFNRYNVYTSPDETILCPDNKQSMYCQLLCGLVQRDDVLRVGAIFASAFLRAIKFLEDHWQELCSNIRTGRVSDWIDVSSWRAAVSSILTKPNSKLADLIEYECCRSESWEGIIKKLWPRTKFIEVIITGSMAQYISTLEFYSGGLPLVSTMYASSECYFGINFKPLSSPYDVSYTLLPNMAYFEFLHVEKDCQEVIQDFHFNGVSDHTCICKEEDEEKTLETVDLVDVQIGQYYELVITTFTGLYRYRVGDILMVTGFHNKAPQFKFIQRRNVILSIDSDKTNEEDLLNAVTKSKLILEPLGFLLTEYTSFADTSTIPGHYVLFYELKTKGDRSNGEYLDPIIMEQCCFSVEESLDSVYRRCRKKDNSIGPLEIRVVKNGTFDELMDYCLSQGSSVNQYKTPRCIKSEEALNILNCRVIGKFFSKKIPFWEAFRMEKSETYLN